MNLTTNKIFDPQLYAVRTLVQNQIDTEDNIDVLQLDFRQRWQTQRGLPGDQRVVDWMVLDLRRRSSRRPAGTISARR